MIKSVNKSLRVPYGQAVHGKEETQNVLRVLNEKRTISGQEVISFEDKIAKIFGKKFGVMVNSGSSANLLAIEILNLPAGSEVITPILTFSTTVMPLVKNGLIPVFIDVRPGEYVIDIDQIEKNITKKTKALMIPLLLGNVPDLERLQKISKKHKLYLIEDSCDTLGATFKKRPSGKYSDVSTISFYGSHIITAGGNGGMVILNDQKLVDRTKVLRGWGRTSSIFGESEDIKKRFAIKLNSVPYDAKFIFDKIGYNFMPSEIGAAFGHAQLKKLPKFRIIREKNFASLLKFFQKYEKFFILPRQDKRVRTQWLAFPLTIKKSAPFTRLEIVTFLEKNNIQTRPIFTGNIMKQPGFKNIKARMPLKSYENTEDVMKRGFVFGCHHGLEDKHINKLRDVFTLFLSRF